jgi:hypothetical protein
MSLLPLIGANININIKLNTMANAGGQPQYRRELAGQVRDLTLKEIKEILEDKEGKVHEKSFRQQVILKLASNVLPRVTELTGEGGGPIQIAGNTIEIKKYGDSSKTDSE